MNSMKVNSTSRFAVLDLPNVKGKHLIYLIDLLFINLLFTYMLFLFYFFKVIM